LGMRAAPPHGPLRQWSCGKTWSSTTTAAVHE
jgi:hypothetical protein